ncbi:cupin domain-containing protein [Paenibacillus sp. CAU 1782]
MAEMLKLPIEHWLYSLKDIQLVTCEPGSGEIQQFPARHTLIAVMSGSGTGQLDGKYYRLRKGGCFLLPSYIFVVNEGEGIRQVMGKEIWRSLTAVACKRVFELSHEQISYFDPISIEGQLDLLGELLQEAGGWNETKQSN